MTAKRQLVTVSVKRAVVFFTYKRDVVKFGFTSAIEIGLKMQFCIV